MIEGEEYLEFKEFVRQHPNQLEPIKFRVLSDGTRQGIDGRNRMKVCEELDITCPAMVVSLQDSEVEDYIDAMNLNRRHLDIDFRRTRVREMISRGKTIREIAVEIGVSPTTVQRDAVATSPETPKKKIVNYSSIKRPRKIKLPRPSLRNSFAESNPDDTLDDDGFSIPPMLQAVFEERDNFTKIECKLNRLATELRVLEASDAYNKGTANLSDRFCYSTFLVSASKKVHDTRPSIVHQDCGGRGCQICTKGYLTIAER